jgi:Protein of unknown function (DUF3363)
MSPQMTERYRSAIERMIDEMVASDKSEQDILTAICLQYKPYDTLPEFGEGFVAYHNDGALRHHPYEDEGGVKAQAYDRGANAAMWLGRAQRLRAELDSFDSFDTAHPDPVGVALCSPDGALSVHLGNGGWEDIDPRPGAVTAVRLWPRHDNALEDYRLFDHTGHAVGRAEVAIIGDRAHVVNIEAEGLGVEATYRALAEKLTKEFPEVELQVPSERKPLDRRELDAAGARLSAKTGLPYTPAAGDEIVAGIYQQPLMLNSGRYAVIDNGPGFTLVPWTPDLERQRGRHVSGVAQDNGSIAWSFERKRALEI